MRAFLSHSSADKGFLDEVTALLKPGTYELDSLTFDKGILSSQAILTALNKCDLFCLFLSDDAISSTYVDFEIQFGIELIAKGVISRLLCVCLTETAFAKAQKNVRYFNIVRRSFGPGHVARMIQGSLISASEAKGDNAHPFIGRTLALNQLGNAVTDHRRPASKALYISGNPGSGRRSFARQFYSTQYRHVGTIFPQIDIDELMGIEEFYRATLKSIRPGMRSAELIARIQSFASSTEDGKCKQVADLLNSLLAANEAAFLYNTGGAQTRDGSFTPEMDIIVSALSDRPHPPVIIVAERRVPKDLRRRQDDVSYTALDAFTRDESRQLISKLLRDASISVADDNVIDTLIDLCGGQPFNFYRMIDEVNTLGLAAFLANPSSFLNWRHRQTSEYIEKLSFTEDEAFIISLLRTLPAIDFQSLLECLNIKPHLLFDAVSRLNNLHIVEAKSDRFEIAPSLKIAIERDHRFQPPAKRYQDSIARLAKSLSVKIEEGSAPISLVDTVVLASIISGNASQLASAFYLPSHSVWLAKRFYDEGDWEEAIRFSKDAIAARGRLSKNALIIACRHLCLASARLGRDDSFNQGIAVLQSLSNDDWARSNSAYLRGFRLRMQGSIIDAERSFRSSILYDEGNLSAVREISAICLDRGFLDEAETFARRAHDRARRNRYFIDTLLAVLIKKNGSRAKGVAEIQTLMIDLKEVGESERRSFFSTRSAELELVSGDVREARKFINTALAKTPHIFEAQLLLARILLESGLKAEAAQQIGVLRASVSSDNRSDGRGNLRRLREVEADYAIAVNAFNEARKIFQDDRIFSAQDTEAALKRIDLIQGYASKD